MKDFIRSRFVIVSGVVLAVAIVAGLSLLVPWGDSKNQTAGVHSTKEADFNPSNYPTLESFEKLERGSVLELR